VSELFNEGDALLFMKVGTHANEPLADIIARKRREIDDAGFSMWGYGGNTCHPRTMVQPFATTTESAGRVIRLCMQPMESKHFAESIRANEYSTDGVSWKRIPAKINVVGSRYALCITDLHEVDSELALNETRVAIGNSKGRSGNAYVKGHVDKACLEVVAMGATQTTVPIGLLARLVEPYAVFLRN
jgi:hypothetical protein